jgi:hypothetical protein
MAERNQTTGRDAQRDLTPDPFPKKEWELKEIGARAGTPKLLADRDNSRNCAIICVVYLAKCGYYEANSTYRTGI